MLDYSVLRENDNKFVKTPSVFCPKKALEQIVEILEDKINFKDIKLEINFFGFENSSNGMVLKSDVRRLQQVLLNLVSNAVKFTNDNGLIQIFVRYVNGGEREKIPQTHIEISENVLGSQFEDDKSYLQLVVVDNGRGIQDKDKKKLFKLFGSVKDEQMKINLQGIGLGLVISKLIVEKFGGKIDYLSEFGKGSAFFFTFGLEQPDPKEIEEFTRIEEQKNEVAGTGEIAFEEDKSSN